MRHRTERSERRGGGAGRRVRFAFLVLIGLAVPALVQAQMTAEQARKRYEKSTKGASIEDYVKRLSSDDPEVRLEAVKSLAATKEKKVIEYIIQALGDPDMRIQAKAVTILGDMRATEATPILVQYLSRRTTDPNLKQRIVAALGKIGDERAARPIMEFLQRDLDPDLRGTAIFALGEIGSPESLDTLTQIAQNDSDATIRRVATEAASKVQHHQAAAAKAAPQPAENFLKSKDKPPQDAEAQGHH